MSTARVNNILDSAGGNTVNINGDLALNRSANINLGTSVVTTSGTVIDFTGIPSWAKRIVIMYNNVSLSGTATHIIQVGAGSFVTSGYTSAGSEVAGTNATTIGTLTTAFIANRGSSAATATFTGQIVLSKQTGNSWVEAGILLNTSAGWGTFSAGSVTLGGDLDRIRLTTSNGTDTFDAGSVNISWE